MEILIKRTKKYFILPIWKFVKLPCSYFQFCNMASLWIHIINLCWNVIIYVYYFLFFIQLCVWICRWWNWNNFCVSTPLMLVFNLLIYSDTCDQAILFYSFSTTPPQTSTLFYPSKSKWHFCFPLTYHSFLFSIFNLFTKSYLNLNHWNEN